jgi:hypothetical protein
MSTRQARSLWVVAVAALAAFGVVGSSTAPAATDVNAATHWNLIAVTTLVAFPGPAGGAPPASQVNMGMVEGAVYDAVNAIEPKHHRPYLLKRRFGANASEDAAVATAAYDVLYYLVSTAPASMPDQTRATLKQSLDSEYASSLGAVADGPFKDQGVAAGHAAAEAMIADRHNDGRFGPSQWNPSTAVGHWWPLTNPATGLPILDPTPWVGGVKPFLMQSSSQFRTPGPRALDSAAYAAEFNETKSLGAVNSATRTPTQTYIARWWQSTPLGWNSAARDLIAENGLDIADSARLFAMENLSAADAAINCWNDKYYYDFWRPWNSIPRAADDGNAATAPDPTWAALITAPYPEHPSGHLCLDGAHTTVLRMFFGDAPEGGFQLTSSSTFLLPGDLKTRTFASFPDTLDELVDARIWAGLHYRTADVQGRQLGTNVANYAADNFFQKVGG